MPPAPSAPEVVFLVEQYRYSDGTRDLTTKVAAEKFLENTWFRCTIDPDSWWYWDKKGHVWRPDGESYLVTWVGSEFPVITKRDFNELKFEIQKRVVIPHENFKPDPNYLQFQDKELNLQTLYDAGPVDVEHYLKTKLATELDLHAEPPREFLKCLRKALPDGIELYRALQAFSTILLIRSMRIEKAFFFIGSGGNGKSTVMKAVENIFENYIAHVDLSDLVMDRFAASQLVDKLANVYADIQTLKLKDLAIFKAISSGDTISINEKYKHRRDETIKVVQFYSANKMPEIENANPGFYRRVFPIIFDQVIKKPDPYIDDKLNTPDEHKRILAMLIKIARTTKRFGFLFERTQEEIKTIIEKNTDPIRQFLDDKDFILIEPEYEIEKGDLYNYYKKYCKVHGYSPKPQASFSRYMTNLGFQSRKSHGDRFFIGVGFPKIVEKDGQEKL